MSMNTIEIKGITKLYGEQKALDNVNIDISKGEIVGLLGPNGAGKSTLMKIITSFISPTEGSVLINGKDVSEDDIETRNIIGYLPENNPLYPEMYVREYLEFVLKIYRTGFNAKERVDEIIELTGLLPESHKKIGELSKGYKQRVGLAQAMIHNPEILILDEPTSGLDPNQLVEIRKIISDFGKEKTVILSTHIMQEVEQLCDRVVIIHQGKVVADDSTSNLWKIAGAGNYFVVEFTEHVERSLLLKIPYVLSVEKQEGNKWLLQAERDRDIRESVFVFATQKKVNILSLMQVERSMEDVFHTLTLNK
jgi:ABC-2 type transport system ATP-binding protein